MVRSIPICLFTLLSVLFGVLAGNTVYAQSNYYKLGIGGGYGFTQPYADLRNHDFSRALYGNLDFFFTPFTGLTGEIQTGKIKSDDSTSDLPGRQFENRYRAISLSGKLHLGAIVNPDQSRFLNTIKWLYVGAGLGFLQNRVDYRTGVDINIRKANSKEALGILNAGFSYYFPDRNGKPRLGINLNVQSNISLGEGLDGYDRSKVTFRDGRPDWYNYYTVGLRYQFAIMGLSKRSLH